MFLTSFLSLLTLFYAFPKSALASPYDPFFDRDLSPISDTITNSVISYNLTAPDGSLKATILNFGATMHAFWVKDKYGDFRDLIAGFDNLTEYTTNRQYFGPTVGRYANRIRNGTFSIPPTRDTTNSTPGHYNVPNNENNGEDALHGGPDGFDQRWWNVTKVSSNSITLSLLDLNGTDGFPSTLLTHVTHTLEKDSTWKIEMKAQVQDDGKTPVLLSSHVFWNLDGWQGYTDDDSEKFLDGHYLKLLADRAIATDGILVPTGEIYSVNEKPALDFREGMKLNTYISNGEAEGICGTNCIGYDTCWIYEDEPSGTNKMSFWSVNSGIRLDVSTNQLAAQVYTCNSINATVIPRKASQGNGTYDYHTCAVLEQEGWIDAINQPEWGQNQIYDKEREYEWTATYKFSTFD